LIDLEQVLKNRTDLAELVAQGMAAVVERLIEVERERDEAKKVHRPIGDSRTTHAPPSTDPRPKPRSQRRKSEKKTGGQLGHIGHRLEPVANPDIIVHHDVNTCQKCHCNLSGIKPSQVTKNQIFDIPENIKLEVTEHQMESKKCPHCKAITTATTPSGAEQPTQYGSRLAGFVIYLHDGHFVPLERTADIIEVVFGRRVSEGWIVSCRQRLSERLTPFITAVTSELKSAKNICCDETGFRFAAHRFWLHVCCTLTLTLFICHRKRGIEGVQAMGILSEYHGTATHDHWSAYFQFTQCEHSVCNEHIVRELDSVTERDGQSWAAEMKQILYDGLDLKHRWHDQELNIPPDDIASITERFQRCRAEGFELNPTPQINGCQKRGRPKRGKTLALLDRLQNNQDAVLRFLHHKHVPWSNNQAERDIRPMKVQQKVSGGFRTEDGAIQFCRIRSYLSTTSKNGINPCFAIAQALKGTPWIPSTVKEKILPKAA